MEGHWENIKERPEDILAILGPPFISRDRKNGYLLASAAASITALLYS
jgi:hypothetical protein